MDLTPLMQESTQMIINGYGPDYFIVSNKKLYNHILLGNSAYQEIDAFDLTFLAQEIQMLELTPIVIIGFAPQHHTLQTIKQQVKQIIPTSITSLEIVENKAACRLFNMLSVENRPVLALIEKIS